MPENIKLLAQYSFTTLEEPLTLENGTTLPVGTRVMLVPQTTAHSVRVPGDRSLLEAWPSLSKEGHVHTDMQILLSGYQTELIEAADRLTRLETWAAQNGYDAAAQE
ncbi:MAG TPA: hypothetical protein H9962_07690 [Candidatus Mailhella merdigallinarum]|uniref:Uncharacterized protein n=1 Tax=Candidatus Mailhella merdigallinarum TaxID=2838658 RepID=A0A9D2HEJ4_9BACT|nr:hypothetical protein [Candidatus Mailhella merdigallinarum]